MTTIDFVKTDWQFYNMLLWLLGNITSDWRTIDVSNDKSISNVYEKRVNGFDKQEWRRTLDNLQYSFPKYLAELPTNTAEVYSRFEFENSQDAILVKLRWS
jgi:hypothetical protein